MGLTRTLEVIITGDPKKALKAFGEVDIAAGGLGDQFASVGKLATVGFALVATAAVGAGVALFKIGESFDESYDKIRVGTGKTGVELDDLKDSFRNVVGDVPTDFGKASDAITKLVQITGNEAGPGLDKLTEQFLELSRITKTDLNANLDSGAKALIGWGVPVEEQSNKLDLLFRTTQLTGVSFADLTGQLNDAGPVLRALGISFDQTAALAGTLGRNGFSLSDVMPALSKSLATAAKEGKGAGDVFRETFDKIKSAPDATVAAGEALTVFGGKAGPKMAELIREGKLSYDDLLHSMQSGSDTIIGAGKDTQDFGEKWELFKNRILLALEPIAKRVFDGMGKAMDALPGIAARLTPAFEKVKDTLAALGQWLADHQAVIQGFAIMVGAFLVAAFLSWAASAAAAAVATIVALAPIVAVGVAIAAVAAGLIYAYQNFDVFRNTVDAVASFLRDTAWPIMQTVFEAIVSAAQSVITFVQDNWHIIADAFSTAVGAFKVVWDSTLQPLLEIMKTLFKDVWDFIAGWVENKINMVRDVVNTVMALFHGDWGAAWDGIKSLFIDAWTGIWDALMGVWTLMQDWFSQLGPRVIGLIGNIGGLLYDKGIELMHGLQAGVGDAWGALAAWLASVPGMIVGFLGDLPGLLYDAGVAAGKALADGVASAIANIPSMIHDAITPHLPDFLNDPGSGGGINSGPQIGHNALGTMSWRGGLSWVGERGPELVNLPRGSAVIPNEQSMQLGKPGVTIVINRDVYGVDDLHRVIQDALAMAV